MSNRSDEVRVVAVDDDRELLELMRELLVDEGYQVHTCPRAADVRDLVLRVHPHLLLIDLRLDGDGEAGWQVLDQLTLDPETRSIPVLLCTGDADSVERRRAALRLEYGLGVCPKPFDLEQLLRSIDSLLGGQGQMGADSQSPPDGLLSTREREVASLVARGCTNAQIAHELVLTEGTVANHVAHIRGKLGFANRAQVAAWAAQLGLLAVDQWSA